MPEHGVVVGGLELHHAAGAQVETAEAQRPGCLVGAGTEQAAQVGGERFERGGGSVIKVVVAGRGGAGGAEQQREGREQYLF